MMTSDRRTQSFWLALTSMMLIYALFIVTLLVTLAAYTSPADLWAALQSREIRFSLFLSLTSCSISSLLSLLVAVPTGYVLARWKIPGAAVIESILDVPIVLPPMVMGLCLLIFFQTTLGQAIDGPLRFTYTACGVVLAQFVIACAFAIRIMRGTFEHLPTRTEEVALTLGCSRWGAFWRISLPSARKGMIAAVTIAWARSLGEFGPILVFAGATRLKTEVLPTTVWLELSAGNLEAAVAVSLLLVIAAMFVLTLVRILGLEVKP